MAGYVQGALQRAGVASDPWSTIYKTLWDTLGAGLAANELARLLAEGAAMREEDVIKLVPRSDP